MILVPAGQFVMGSPDTEAGRETNEGPQRSVTIAKPFALAKYETTVGEFAAFVRETGYVASNTCPLWQGTRTVPMPGTNWKNHPFAKSDSHPVLCVSREDTDAYVAWLAAKTGQKYRLPSEAEWEYAAREGGQRPNETGVNGNGLCRVGNVADAALKKEVPEWPSPVVDCDDGFGRATAPVGSFAPNAFGLYDMQGNVWEFTQDCYADTYADAPTDGSAHVVTDCKRRTVRGGGWLNGPGLTQGMTGDIKGDGEHRPANRGRNSPGAHFDSMGFRVARDAR
ncbi:MAG: formylglycine-generating enzyme family protein [Rhodospirillaceae bacterium]|nr:formylglycine-generating enzyme family protein [Rhodospirillaceae bacterium]